MYLHLGREVVVRTGDIVGIFDLDTATVEQASRDFLAQAEAELRVTTISPELPKSFIVTVEGGRERVYISQIAATTLQRRATNTGQLTIENG